jgi:hypothetical protein
MDRNHLFYAFLATLVTVVTILLIVAVLAFYGKYAEALGVSGVLTGLISLATLLARGTPVGNTQADTNLATALDKLPPATTGTGPAVPVEDAK